MIAHKLRGIDCRGCRAMLAVVLVAVSLLQPAAGQAQDAPPSYISGEVIIGWRPESGVLPEMRQAEGLDEDRTDPDWQRVAHTLRQLTGLIVLDAQPTYALARLAAPPGREAAEAARLQRLPWVAYAGLNHIAYAAAAPDTPPYYPKDPLIGDQWNMRRVGAPEAWAVTRGSYSLVVAVLDSGIDRLHVEFANRLLPGYDYVNGDNDPTDDFGHGTHVTGILAAAADNGVGVAGLAPNVKILPLKVLDKGGGGSYYNIATAIRRAADSAAQIINLSLGGFQDDTILSDAIDYAHSKGVLVVAAAGNCAQPGGVCGGAANPMYYPAAYPGVLAVAASDHYDNWAAYSGHRPYVGIAAPGGVSGDQIRSTLPGGYGYKNGTSMATPLVSAAAALAWTLSPAATSQQVVDILQSTADKVPVILPDTGQLVPYVNGRNDYFGFGRLNVGKAVRWAYPPTLTPVTEPQRFLLGGPVTQQTRWVTLENPSAQGVLWKATVTYGGLWITAIPEMGSTAYGAPGSLAIRVGPVTAAAGVYTGTVKVQALYPSWVAGFEIPVQLQVSTTVRRSSLPLVQQQRPANSWLDPFAGGGLGGQGLYLGDNTLRQLALPFPVTFYNRTYSAVWISDNGLLFFSTPGSGWAQPPTACLPSAAAPNNALYALALDWNPTLGGQIYIHQPDADTYAVTWYQMVRAGSPLPQSFQLVFRRSGSITANYLTVEPATPGIVGAENDDGTVAQQIRCNSLGWPVESGDSIPFNPVLPW